MEGANRKRRRTTNLRKIEERKRVAMNRFRANYEKTENIIGDFNVAKEGYVDILEMYSCTDPEKTSRMMTTCIGLTSNEKDAMQKCAYYLSAVSLYIPSLGKVAKKVLNMKGYDVLSLNEKNLEENEIELEGAVNRDKSAAIAGQLIMLLFKNISDRSYDIYIKKRAAALKAIVGYHGDLLPGCEDDVLLNQESAAIVSNVLGASCLLRSTIMHAVIANSEYNTSFGAVSGYIMGIAAWTEMNALKHIFDTLLAARSPVLGVDRLAAEVLNLQVACMTINRTDYPQFFKIFHPTAATRVLEKHQFANLTAIAKRIKSSDQASMNNYVGVTGVDQAFILEMVTLHVNETTKKRKEGAKKAEKFLTDINMHPELDDSESESEAEE